MTASTQVGITMWGPPFTRDGLLIFSQGQEDMNGAYAGPATLDQRALYRPFAAPPTAKDEAVFLGADARFFVDPDVDAYANGVVKLKSLNVGEKTFLGYIYGGIEALGPKGKPDAAFTNPFRNDTPGGTFASHRIYRVFMTIP